MPVLGFGTWLLADGPETEDAVRAALELGYRHLDTAQAYGNEASVGRAVGESGIPRDEIFVTTKFNPHHRDPEAELEQSLARLGLDHVDLYLVHNPQGGPKRAWPGMERCHQRGLTRSIGVSNFDARELQTVTASASVRPAANQIQLNPFRYRRGLMQTCQALGIVVQAWSPLARGEGLHHRTVVEVAEAVGRTPAQVLLRWGIQRDAVVITRSTRRERTQASAQIFDFTLDDEQMARLDALDQTGGTDEAVEDKWWTPTARGRAAVSRVLGRLRR